MVILLNNYIQMHSLNIKQCTIIINNLSTLQLYNIAIYYYSEHYINDSTTSVMSHLKSWVKGH